MEIEQEAHLLVGINSVREKLKASPREITEILVVKGRQRPALRALAEEARRLGLQLRDVDSTLLDRLAGQGHQGVVAKVAPFRYLPFEFLLEKLPALADSDCILFLDQVTDPRNFGALLRSAEGAGVRHVVIPKDRSVRVTPAVDKSSAGALHHLNIYRVINLRRALEFLKEKGYWVVGLEAGARESIFDRLYPEKLVVVLGSEGFGLRPLIRKECDFLASIPMQGKLSSLNVAVAGGVFLYELLRQRRWGGERSAPGGRPAPKPPGSY